MKSIFTVNFVCVDVANTTHNNFKKKCYNVFIFNKNKT